MNVNRNNTGDFYRNQSIGANGPSTLAAAVSDLDRQQRFLGGSSGHFSLSERIAALAAGGGGVAAAPSADGGAAAAAAAALSSLGKIGGGGGGGLLGGTSGLLNSALQSDGKFTKPVVDLQGHPKKVHDAAAMAAVFPPIVKPPQSSLVVETAADVATGVAEGLDTDELKRQQRLEQNKMSARRSRRRKKIILEELQTTIDQLTAENDQLEEENKRLEEELERRKKAAEKGGGEGGRVSTTGTTATTTTGRPAPSTVPSSFITGSGLSNGTGMPIVMPSTNNRSLLVSQISTIMNGQAVPGLLPQSTPGASIVAGPAGLTATSIINSIATPAPRPSQLYLSRPTVNANVSTSQAAAAQEQLHRSILSMYQEQERKNANKKRRLENQLSN